MQIKMYEECNTIQIKISIVPYKEGKNVESQNLLGPTVIIFLRTH
jgi:hypothetical protein